jgi:nucleoside-diphosphate-sugar epimerase
MIATLEQTLGRKAVIMHQPVVAADMPNTAADVSKAARLLNWRPQVSSQDGLQRCAQWHAENAEWLGRIELG